MNGAGSTKLTVLWIPQWWLGVLLLAVCWPINWSVRGSTAYFFFPLWLGYILVVDALVLSRTGTSLWTRSRRDFALLFVASSPVWWIFEVINQRTNNWEYLGTAHFTQVEYYLLCTLSFSTVMPAVFETAELARSFGWIESRFVFERSGDADSDTPLAALLLPFRLVFPGADPGAAELLAGPLFAPGRFTTRRLATRAFARGGRPYLRLFLGDVELLFRPKMDLPYPGSPVPARVRNAAAGLWGLHPVCAGALRVEEFLVASLAAAAPVG